MHNKFGKDTIQYNWKGYKSPIFLIERRAKNVNKFNVITE